MIRASGRLPDGASLLGRWEALGRPLPHLPRWAAALVLALLAAAMAWGAVATAPVERAERATNSITATTAGKLAKGKGDLALYSRIADRVIKLYDREMGRVADRECSCAI